jgi:hypothetical protein
MRDGGLASARPSFDCSNGFADERDAAVFDPNLHCRADRKTVLLETVTRCTRRDGAWEVERT